MKNFKLIFLVVTLVAMLMLQGCPESSNPVDESEGGKVEVFRTDQGGSLKTTGGAEIMVPTGAIAPKGDGSSGAVSFSIETNVNMSDLELPLPSSYKLIGSVYGYGPANFVFAEPLQIYLPAGSESTPEGLSIAWYNDSNKEWVLLPINDVDEVGKRLGTSVMELGYFAVVKPSIASSIGKKAEIQNDKRVGGIKLTTNSSDYYYTMTIIAVTYKYPEIGWPDLVGYNVSTGSYPTGGPLPVTRMGNIPQGTYTIEVSRVKRGTFMQLPGERETYTNPALVTVGGFTSVGGWGMDSWTGWSELNLSGGQWRTGDPSNWPKPTVPFGTGQFQATLTWVNSGSNWTDLDLHLIGPNGMHVYFADEVSSDGSVMLDVDWIDEPGNAVENIFSTNLMPKGEYKVYVMVFDGFVPKPYEVRIIRQGSIVKTFRGSATKISDWDDDMIHIQTFRID